MKRMLTYRKLLFREVKKTITRFISILAIVLVGVGFLAGLTATTPDMQLTADNYYDNNNLFDINIKGTLGLTLDDLDKIQNLDYVNNALICHVTDLTMSTLGGSYVTRIYGVPMDKVNDKDFVNGFELVKGRLPTSDDECVIASPNGYIMSDDIIDKVYTISADNKDYDKIDKTYNYKQVKCVGVVKTPYYMSIESEPSTVGTGQVSLVMFVNDDFYNMDAYTDIFLTVNGAKEMNSFDQKYTDLVEKVTDELESFGVSRSEIRYVEIINENQKKIDDAQKELTDAKQTLYDAKNKLNVAIYEYDNGVKQLEDAKSQYNTNYDNFIKAYNYNLYQLNLLRPSIGETEYQIRLNALNVFYEQTQYEFYLAKNQILDAELKLDDAKIKIEDAKIEIADAEQEIIDNQLKLDDAQSELNDLEKPKWYLFDRRDTVSYSSYKSNSNKISAIAKVFPIFFFFVAALVSLTTMTRMVEEERGQIGTLKALGYSNNKITSYYVLYSVLASLIGSILGCVLGFNTLPVIISNTYKMMYSIPQTITKFWWNHAIIISAIAITCTTVATLFACIGQLKEKPSTLMLPKAPKAGKRVFLERIGFIWKRMNFTSKVTARNILRYKKRFYMTVIGIAGCTALLVTGFGLRDSISDIVRLQFDEIYKYNLTIRLSEDGADVKDDVVKNFLQNNKHLTNYGLFHNESITIENDNGSSEINMFVAKNTEQMSEQFNFRKRKSKENIPFNDESFILTEKLCETLGISVGDTVTIKNSDGDSSTAVVTGICENYVTAFCYTSVNQYSQMFDNIPDFCVILAQLNDQSEQARKNISTEILASDNILLLSFSQTIRDSFSNTINRIYYIVAVLIISAAALAVIVLYNLTNINICERKKELATIKVLGFHDREVANYIFREINILCIIGTLCGLLFGTWLHSFVVATAEVDAVMFGRTIYPLSYLISSLLTITFALLVNLLMKPKLKKIDMVESMKANE